ncbi:MAG: TMEM175 family protein [Bryobacteraceae bacterium]
MPGPKESAEKETGRVEAFSDGVFAIAITLLILELHVPPFPAVITPAALLAALLKLWPSAVALVLSFFVILIMWISHHELMRLVRRVDNRFLIANGVLLLMVTVVPFPTAVLAQYLSTPAANAAAAFYCGTFVLIGAAYNVLFASVASNRRLVHHNVSDELLEKIGTAYRMGFLVYVLATAVSWWYAPAGLILYSSLWILWIALSYRDQSQPTPP